MTDPLSFTGTHKTTNTVLTSNEGTWHWLVIYSGERIKKAL